MSNLTGSFVAKGVERKIRGPHLGGGRFDVEQEIIRVRSIVRRVVTTTTPDSTRIRVIEQLLPAARSAPGEDASLPGRLIGLLDAWFLAYARRLLSRGIRRGESKRLSGE